MPGVSADQVKLAKEVDLLSYLQAADPRELKKTAPGEYRTVTHSSLVISKGKWIWNRGGIGGRTALDYLIKIRGMGFVAAVDTVLSCQAAWSSSSRSERPDRAAPALLSLPVERRHTPEPKTLCLPQRVSVPANAVKYLQQRGIRSDVISQCLKSGVLYEGRYKNAKEPELDGSAVCVFVGCDNSGKERFAALRGIGTDLKRDAAGSDKRFGFMLPAKHPNSRELAVFEAPIDMLSHATLARRGETDFEGYRLSLGGVSDIALTAYLDRNPAIQHISLCLDNDDAGRTAAKRIFDALGNDERYRDIAISIDLPEGAKDYNEVLLQSIDLEREHKKDSPNRGAVLSL